MATKARPAQAAKQRLQQRLQAEPRWFADQCLGVHLWSRQVSVLDSVREHRKTAVRSGHGTGKTFLGAVAALWFLYSFPDSRVVTTATTWRQVEKLLWHEINRLYRGAQVVMGGRCLNTELQLDDFRYAIGLSSDPREVESFAGHHAPNLLLIFDEASGVPAPVYEAGQGYMTTAGAKQLLIGNPLRADGEFYAAFHSKRDEYQTHHISVLDTPNFTGEPVPDGLAAALPSPEWAEQMARYKGTALHDVRVLGNFPSATEDTVIALAIVENAQQRSREIHPHDGRVVGVDVARFGHDETVIATRHGRKVRIVDAYVGRDLMHTVGQVIRAAKELGPDTHIVVDDTGLGGGVTDRLREQDYPVTAFNGGEQAREPDEYPNRRSESWFEGADELLDVDLDDDEQLAADLVAPRYKMTSRGQRQVEAKDVTKKRLGRSPDRADAVLLTFADTAGVDGTVEIWGLALPALMIVMSGGAGGIW